jgi:hypothetical protein
MDLSTLSDEELMQLRQRAAAAPKAPTAMSDEELLAARRSSLSMPKPPPGVVIHGADRSYLADDPSVSTTRLGDMVTTPQGGRDMAVTMETLKQRADAQPWQRAGLPAAQGATLGLADEASSAIRGAASAATGGNFRDTFDMSMERQRQELDRERTENPIRSTVTEMAGTVPLALAAPGQTAASLGGRVLKGAAAAIPAGFIYGYGSGSGTDDRLEKGAKGAAVSGVLGAGAPVVGAGVSKAYEGIKGRFIDKLPQDLRGFSRGAINNISGAAADDVLDPATAGRYGPEGMIADLGDNLRDQAGGIANMGGKGQTDLRRALDARREGAAGRITADTDAALGKTFNVPETLKKIKDRADAAAKPFYDKFRSSPVPYTQELDDIVTKLKNEPSVLVQARRLANLDESSGPNQFFAKVDPNGNVTIERVPNANEWDYIKRALDGMTSAGKRAGDDNSVRIYNTLAKRVRDNVDAAISPGNPADSVWAKGRAIKAEDFQLQEAFDAGANAFSKKMRPDELEFAMKGYTPGERLAFQMGARSHVQNVMGNAATKFRSNADTAAMRELGSDFAREKLATITDPAKAGQLTNRLDAEAAFETTRDLVTQNSATPRRLAVQKQYPTKRGTTGEGARGMTVMGLLAEGAVKAANLLTGGMIKANDERIAADAAKMLAASGADRDRIATALIAFGQGKSLTQAQAELVEKFAGALVNSGRGPTTQAVTSGGR